MHELAGCAFNHVKSSSATSVWYCMYDHCYCSSGDVSGFLTNFLERDFFLELVENKYPPNSDMYQVLYYTTYTMFSVASH